MHLTCITRFEELVALQNEWTALELAGGADLPFQTWEWAVAWWTHFREHSRGVRDHLRVYVVRDTDDRVIAIAPMLLTERPAFGPLRVRYLQFMGADPNVTELRRIVCRPDHELEAVELLREHLTAQRHLWDWLVWEGRADSFSTRQVDETSSYVLTLPEHWGTMKRQLGRNLKESLRHCYNSLRRAGLSYSMETVEDVDGIDGALRDFLRLHAARAMLTDAPRHPDVFASVQARNFLVDVCRRLSARGITRVFRLRVGDRIVAIRIGFQLGRTLYLYYSGWEPEYAPYSVMTTLLAEIIQHAIARGASAVNLSTGNDVSKTRWGPTEIRYSAQTEVSPRLGARARYAAFHLIRTIGSHPAARALVPGALVRRSERRWIRTGSFRVPKVTNRDVLRLHALVATAAALVALDLLDNRLDHLILLLPRIFEHFLG